MSNQLNFGNKVVFIGGLPLTLPTAAVDPGSPSFADLYYNTTSNVVKYYNGSTWVVVGGSAGITDLTGDVTASGSGSVPTTVAAIQGIAVGGTTGTGNVAFSVAPTFDGPVVFTGSFYPALTSINHSNSPYTVNVSTNDIISVDTNAGAVVINLPGNPAIGPGGPDLWIADIGGAAATNNITVQATGGDDFADGSGGKIISQNFGWIHIVYHQNIGGWVVLGSSDPGPVVVGDFGSGGVKGLVPAPQAGDAAAGKFLGADALWTNPFDSIVTNPKPDTNADYDLGTDSVAWGYLYVYNGEVKTMTFSDPAQFGTLQDAEFARIVGNSSGGRAGGVGPADLEIFNFTTAGSTIGTGTSNDVGIRLQTADSSVASDTTRHTSDIEIVTGNATGGSQDSGGISLITGTVAGGTRGSINLTAPAVKLSGYLDEAQQSTPANPAAGRNRLYFKNDDILYKLTSAGVESQVGGSPVTFADSLVNTAGTVTLVNDSASPGNAKFYGTSAAGTLGYYTLPAQVLAASTVLSGTYNGSVVVTGAASQSGAITVVGDLIVQGAYTISDAVTVTGNMVVYGNITTSGSTLFAVNVGGDLVSQGGTISTSGGAITVWGSVSDTNLTATGPNSATTPVAGGAITIYGSYSGNATSIVSSGGNYTGTSAVNAANGGAITVYGPCSAANITSKGGNNSSTAGGNAGNGGNFTAQSNVASSSNGINTNGGNNTGTGSGGNAGTAGAITINGSYSGQGGIAANGGIATTGLGKNGAVVTIYGDVALYAAAISSQGGNSGANNNSANGGTLQVGGNFVSGSINVNGAGASGSGNGGNGGTVLIYGNTTLGFSAGGSGQILSKGGPNLVGTGNGGNGGTITLGGYVASYNPGGIASLIADGGRAHTGSQTAGHGGTVSVGSGCALEGITAASGSVGAFSGVGNNIYLGGICTIGFINVTNQAVNHISAFDNGLPVILKVGSFTGLNTLTDTNQSNPTGALTATSVNQYAFDPTNTKWYEYDGIPAGTSGQTTLTGSAGTAICSQPSQGANYKKVLCYLSGYTDTGTQIYTFPTAFVNTPYVYGHASGVAGATATTTTVTFSVTTETGFVFIEGY